MRTLPQDIDEFLPLLSGEKLEKSRHREQQRLWISVVPVDSGQEVRTDHLPGGSRGIDHFPASQPPFRSLALRLLTQ